MDKAAVDALMRERIDASMLADFHFMRQAKLDAHPRIKQLATKYPQQHLAAVANLVYDALLTNFGEAYGAYRAQAAVNDFNETHDQPVPEDACEPINDAIHENLGARTRLVADHTKSLASHMDQSEAERFMGSVIKAATDAFRERTGITVRVARYATREIHAGV